jgi:hypothetical protein
MSTKKEDCLTPPESSDYSLWKATKKLKQVKKMSPFGHHKELGEEVTLKNHMRSLNV